MKIFLLENFSAYGIKFYAAHNIVTGYSQTHLFAGVQVTSSYAG